MGVSVCDRLLVPAMCCGKVVTLRQGVGGGEEGSGGTQTWVCLSVYTPLGASCVLW